MFRVLNLWGLPPVRQAQATKTYATKYAVDEPVLEFSLMGSEFKSNYKKRKRTHFYTSRYTQKIICKRGGLLEMCKEGASGGRSPE
jgi:hypothetical protein